MDNEIKTIAVVVTHNRISLLKECIAALLASSVPVDILIVNNASTDGTKEYLDDIEKKEKTVKFYIYNQKENLNGAGGFNFGIKMAASMNYKYIWIMDDDTCVENDAHKYLLQYANAKNNEFGFLSSKVLWTDGSICKTNVQRLSVARFIRDFESDVVKCDFCSFVSCFVKRESVIKVGLPIKDFIIWTDDLEWTRRLTYDKINKYASPGYLINSSVVIHKCKNNFGVSIVYDEESSRIDRYKYIYRNDVYCFRREGIRGYIYIIIRNLYHIFRIILFSKNNKLNKIKTIIVGFNEGLKFNPKVEFVEGVV